MARASQSELAVLGALSVRPMTGYELRAEINEALGHFWHESFGQLYPTLTRLEQERLVRRAEPGRTSGSRFALTTAGRRRLRALLREPFDRPRPRNPLLLRLFFGAAVGPEHCTALVEEALDDALAQLAALAEIRDAIGAERAAGQDDPGVPYRVMTLSAGEHAARAQVAWAEETLAELARLRGGTPPPALDGRTSN